MGLSPEFARPEWMLITILAVPPMTVRPSVSIDGNSRGEDDLTYKLIDIMKANTSLKRFETEGVNALVLSEFEDLLQFHVATYMDNDIAGLPQALQKSGRPVRVFPFFLYLLHFWLTSRSCMADQIHSGSTQGQGRAAAWESHGKKSRLFRSHCHYG